jgi:uncharacterized protein DUF3307
MISSVALLFLMLIHWLADFVLQTDEMAKGKSKSNYWLSYHVGVYTLIMAGAASCLIPTFGLWTAWVAFNGVAHWVTDYFTSRWSSQYFTVGDYHNGFVVVGLDQWIHLTCIALSSMYCMLPLQ